MFTNLFLRIVWLIGALLCMGLSGVLLPGINRMSEQAGLRYTNVSVSNAPPFVALGTAIGALRGLIVDYLWIKVNLMKEEGLFYEVMADSELITKLQPRFAGVWIFHAHNMAYNISVATHTQEERWEWVKAGIHLLRDEALRYNPNSMELHKELAFFFTHKVEGVSDDAHLYYKTQFCGEWHMLLGEPPVGWDERIEWIREIADAPDTLAEVELKTPGVQALVDRIKAEYPANARITFTLGRDFLNTYSYWQAVTQQSEAAKVLGEQAVVRENRDFFKAFGGLAGDASLAPQWKALLAYVRKQVLINDYNMEPQRMYEYTRDLGPLDWRHGDAHALYWARRGLDLGAGRIKADDVYHEINTDRVAIQAMQELARWGRITFDPFSNELPGRFPDLRWMDTIEREFERLYAKYYNTRGAGGETFIDFLKNFMASCVRQWYRAGETVRAQEIMDKLNILFPKGGYNVPLDAFVMKEVREQYEAQPHLAPGDVAASLQYGIRVGIGTDRPEVWNQALKFASDVTAFFKGNEYNNYVNKWGRGRMAEIIGGLEDTVEIAYMQYMTDPSFTMDERMTVWGKTDKYAPQLRALAWVRIKDMLRSQYQRTVLSRKVSFEQAFPAPPGIEAAEQALAQRKARREAELAEARKRDDIARQQ